MFACRQANVAYSVLACQFHHADLATGERLSGKSDQAPNTDVGQAMLASIAKP